MDTSIISHLQQEDVPEKMWETRELWKYWKKGGFLLKNSLIIAIFSIIIAIFSLTACVHNFNLKKIPFQTKVCYNLM